jgi:hypothetical protein
MAGGELIGNLAVPRDSVLEEDDPRSNDSGLEKRMGNPDFQLAMRGIDGDCLSFLSIRMK